MELTTLGGVLLASLVGSPHCAGMCGGFVLFYAGKSESKFWSHVSYSGGRLLTYSLLGVLAGFVGQKIDDIGTLVGFQQVMAIITGVLLIGWGLKGLLGGNAGFVSDGAHQSRFFQFVSGLFRRVLREKDGANWVLRAFLIGAFSTFLPCGWLYMFAAVAAATSDPVAGAAVMAVFWVGTLPVLLAIGGATTFLSAGLRKHIPRITGLLLIVAGVFALTGRFQMLFTEGGGHHHHHHGGGNPALEELMEQYPNKAAGDHAGHEMHQHSPPVKDGR